MMDPLPQSCPVNIIHTCTATPASLPHLDFFTENYLGLTMVAYVTHRTVVGTQFQLPPVHNEMNIEYNYMQLKGFMVDF